MPRFEWRTRRPFDSTTDKLSREEKYGSTEPSPKFLLDALAADDIDTDCNGVMTMANLTVTMTTTRRRPLSQEEIEALIDLRIAQLRVLAAQTAVEWWRELTGANWP